jgi:hypothetical protein
MSSIRVKQAGRDVKKLMNLNSYQNCRQGLAVKKEDIEIAKSGFPQKRIIPKTYPRRSL